MTSLAVARRLGGSTLRSAAGYLRLHLLVTIAVVIVIVSLENPRAVSGASLANLLNSISFVGFVALGETVLLLSGEFDLSVGAVSGLCSVVAALAMVNGGAPVLAGVLVAVVLGGAFGLANGVVTVKFGVPSFITTIGMAGIASGLGLFITRGEPVRGLPPEFLDFGAARLGGLSWMFLIFAGLAIGIEVVLHLMVPGRHVFATGGDPTVARLAGINTGRVKITAFVVTGMLAGTAGILQASFQSTALATTGSSGVELQAIAAAIIGGTSILGGAGSIFGTIAGLLLIGVVTNGLVAVGVPTNWQGLAVGMILIAAIGLDVLQRRIRQRRGAR